MMVIGPGANIFFVPPIPALHNTSTHSCAHVLTHTQSLEIIRAMEKQMYATVSDSRDEEF